MYQVFQQLENLLQYKCNTILILQIIQDNNAINCNVNTAQQLHGDTAHAQAHTRIYCTLRGWKCKQHAEQNGK